MVSKKTGFAAPYRSLTFRSFLSEIINRNGVMSMAGEVSEALGIVTIPAFTFNQQGLIVNVSTAKTITKPTLSGTYLLIVSAPTTANVDDLVYTFAESPLDVNDNEVIIAEWDGGEWKHLPFLSIDDVIKGLEQDRLDFSWDGPISGFITTVDGLSYRNTAGVMVDRTGRKTRVDEDALFSIIPDDPNPAFSRVDRLIYRRPVDNTNRVGARELLLGGTYSPGAQINVGVQVLAGPAVHSRVRLGLYGNEVVVLATQGFGSSFTLWLGRVADDRSTMSQASTQLAGITASTDEADLVVDKSTGDCYITYVFAGDIYFLHTDLNGNIVDGPVQINTQTQPCSSPRIVRDRSGKFLITFLVLMGPGNNQVFFASCDDAGATITGAKRVTNTATNHIHQDMVVTPDYALYLVYEDQTQGKIYYDILDDIGNLKTVSPVYISANVVSNSFGTNSDNASHPKVRITDSKDVFFFFLQNIGGDSKLAIVKNSNAGFAPDVVGIADDFISYDVQVSDWMNDIWVYVSDSSQSSRVIIEGENDIAQSSVLAPSALVVSVEAGAIAILQDKTGSLFVVQSDAFSGVYSNVGTPETVQHIGPASLVGSMATVNLSSNQIALLTAGLSQTPAPGQLVTLSGSADPLNDGSKLVTQVDVVDYNTAGEYTVVSLDSSFNSAESPAVAALAQFAEPDGAAVNGFKTTAELASRALRKDVLDGDVLLSRIVTPGPTLLNYVQNPVFGGGTTALAQQFGVYGSSQIDWESTTPGEFTIAANFGIVDLFNDLDYAIQAGGYPMAEGEALYVKLDGANFNVTPQVALISTLPFGDPIQVLGFIKGGSFNPVLLTVGGGEQLDPGEIIVIGEDLPAPIRTRLGILSDTSYEAYTNLHRLQIADSYPTALSRLDRAAQDHDQDRNTKLIEGGSWSLVGSVLSWSADAYIQTPDCANTRNTIPAGNITLAANEVAYVDINRAAGAAANLTVQVALITALTKGPDRFVIARSASDGVIVGTHSFKLVSGESKPLDAGASNQTLSALGLPSEADEGPLRLMAIAGSKRIRITPTDKLVFDGTTWGNEISGLPMQFDGFQLDLETGDYYGYGDGTVAGSGPLLGSAFTPSSFTNPNVYRWYSVSFVADTVDVDGTMQVKPLVLPGTPDAPASASAVKAAYSGKKLGQVLVQAVGTGSVINNVVQSNIIQLSSGAGGSGSGTSAALVGGGNLVNTVTETPLAADQNLVAGSATTLGANLGDFVGQTYQPASDRFLKSAVFRAAALSGVPNGLLQVEVYEIASLTPAGPVPTGRLGVSSQVDASELGVAYTNKTFTFEKPVLLRAGKFYAIIVKASTELAVALSLASEHTNPAAGAVVSGDTSTIATTAGSDLYFVFNVSTYSCLVEFTRPIYVEQPRLSYADNKLPVSEGPFVLPTPDHVAYVDRLNASIGGPELTLAVGLITDTRDGQLIVARRDGLEVLFNNTRIAANKVGRIGIGTPPDLDVGVTFQQDLRERLNRSYLEWLTPNIIALHGATRIDGSSTGAVDVENAKYDMDGPPPFSPIIQPGESQPSVNQVQVTGGPTKVIGQTFVPPTSFKLASIQVRLRQVGSPTGNFKLRIWGTTAGAPNASSLIAESAPVDATTFDTSLAGDYVTFIFNDEILTGGVAYAIGFDIIDLGAGQLQLAGSSSNPYAPGDIYFASTSAGPWTQQTGNDLYFNIQGSTLDGEFLLSTQQYGAQFLADQQDNRQIELQALWSMVDAAADYRVSQDGGSTYEDVVMERVGESQLFRGVKVLATPAGSVQSTYAVANASATAELNATTRRSYAIKQPAIPAGTKKKIVSGNVYVTRGGTAPDGDLVIKLVADNGGVPGTTILGQNSSVIPLSSLPAGDSVISFSIPAILTAQTYWLVIETTAAYKATFSAGVKTVFLRVDNTSPSYAEGDSYQFDGTTWTAHAGNQAVFSLSGFNYDLRVKIVSSKPCSLKGYGIFYGELSPQNLEAEQSIQRIDVDGGLNTTEFTITKFIPDPMKLRVYDVSTGQVYRWPAFAVDGRKVVFASNQFFSPGNTIILLFDQSEQGSVDNSDRNAALLAANRLGSTDETMDMSVAGEGPLLRASNGQLVETSVRWNGAAYEWVFAEV